MHNLLRPTRLADAVWSIDLDWLASRRIRGLILDLDNTLVDWNDSRVRPEVRAWLQQARARGFALCIASNAVRAGRVGRLAKELGLKAVTHAGKPLPAAFRHAMAALGTSVNTTCAIGDQLFTDMLGANWLGMTTVLVDPLSPRESPHTRLIRLIERPIRRRWKRSRAAQRPLCPTQTEPQSDNRRPTPYRETPNGGGA